VAGLFLLLASTSVTHAQGNSAQARPANNAFAQAEAKFHVPQSLLKAICYMEGRLSNHGGNPSIDNGFGCMHLVKNNNADTLDQAAKNLGVSTSLLREDLDTNIRGGAAVLRDTALQLSPNHTLPMSLADWYDTVATYSHATVNSTATMYANAVYTLLRQGFTAQTDTGETVTLAPQVVQLNKSAAARLSFNTALPGGCTNDTKVDYPGAVGCIVPQSFNCSANHNPCSYKSANRPTDYSIDKIVIHDTEGSLQDALNIFQNVSNGVSVQYLVDTDGTVYQLVRENAIAYHAGNYWYNQHSIGVEHVGYDAQGYQWYNATQYLASARLVAYLLQKYHLPLDRTHIVAHGTLPSGSAATKNHFDPGPYWLWDYYFGLIHQQGIPFPTTHPPANTITLHPQSDQHPDGPNGTETTANFNFFYLYTSANTRSSRIPQIDSTDLADVSNSVEPGIPYTFVAKAADAAGTGDTMYKIWYGETDRAQNTPPSYFADGHLAWLDVPAGDGVEGSGTGSYGQLALRSQSGSTPQIYARPTSKSAYIIGRAPAGTAFAIGETYVEDGTRTLWYEINFNHRQAWVPASEMSRITYSASQTHTAMAPNADGHLD